jgi:hypothetical protein
MLDVNYLAIAVAVVASFVLSSLWYGVFGKQLKEFRGATADAAATGARLPAWKILVEVIRSLLVASVLAGLGARLAITDWLGAVQLGLSLWIGFPLVLLVGSVIWENVPWRLAAIHAGDWLVKLLIIAAIVLVWR